MSKTELILQQIATLTPEETEAVYQELKRRLDRVARARAALDKVKGKGTGVWGLDAQDYVNQLRENDRF